MKDLKKWQLLAEQVFVTIIRNLAMNLKILI